MPNLSFSFQGYVRKIPVAKAYTVGDNPKEIDVSNLSTKELLGKLRSGEIVISLSELLQQPEGEQEVEIFDFEDDDEPE